MLKLKDLFQILFVVILAVRQGAQGLSCCQQYGNETDCASGTVCAHDEYCYHEVILTDTGNKLHLLGCRNTQLCAGGALIGRRGSANVLCSTCCDQSFCNTQQCQAVDVCHPNPCLHGRCTRQASGYTCTCNQGYTGSNCDQADPCANNHFCLHGTCFIDTKGQTQCNCDIGYSGNNCESKEVCHPNPCVHGICKASTSGYFCTCNHGYTGSNCDQVDACAQRPCLHGVCSTSVSGWQCTCDPGFDGRYCDIDIDECASSPCKHGVCYDHVNDFTCDCFKGYTGQTCDRKVGIRDCKDVLDNSVPSIAHNDIYPIKIGDVKVNVRCDMVTVGGGWTILMNRETGQTDFMLSSTRYALGFGSNTGNFWIGLENMHKLTSDGRRYTLRVELTMGNGTKYYEDYDDFSIGQQPAFTLHIGSASGTAGDSLSSHNGFGFSAYDVDRDDNHGTACSNYLQGAWWFHNCYDSCLTCPYVTANGEMTCRSMSWNSLGYCMPLKAARMMTRPMP